MEYNFSGWATKNDVLCTDGRIIRHNAFAGCDGKTVPLVWNHQHSSPEYVLGHALLENRDEGVYAYCTLNDTPMGQSAKIQIEHGDIEALSIYANQLKQTGPNVMHGVIREVSLVLAGANQGAFIDNIIKHGEECEDEAVIYHAVENDDIVINHSDEKDTSSDDKTIADVFNTFTEEQKNVVYAMIGQALEYNEQSDNNKENENEESEGGNNSMKHNVFEQEGAQRKNTLSHADEAAIIADAKRYGSLKESALQHGIEQIDYLFPEAKPTSTTPEFISRDMTWVNKVLASVHHTPFSRIKSLFADITADDARAKGYIKGRLKKEEVFSLLKRTTTPTTIYKKQKLDRDDVVDITDFDVIAWLKKEMRTMLDEEIARAVLVGDGRLASSDDKINEGNIRPVWTDHELYTIKTLLDGVNSATSTGDEKAKAFIRAAIKTRKEYKGSGQPTLYTTEDVLTDCLLLEDKNGRIIYDSESKLATALRVKEIVTVPVMENCSRTNDEATEVDLMGIIVNLADYNVGADKGGAVNMFDDFDIDYNAQKYLIETRCSGALVKPKSAIAIEIKKNA